MGACVQSVCVAHATHNYKAQEAGTTPALIAGIAAGRKSRPAAVSRVCMRVVLRFVEEAVGLLCLEDVCVRCSSCCAV